MQRQQHCRLCGSANHEDTGCCAEHLLMELTRAKYGLQARTLAGAMLKRGLLQSVR